MTRPGPDLALLLLGSYRRLVDAAVVELEARGYKGVRPSLHYALSAVDHGAGSASELGRALSVSKQAAAKTITALADRGWVEVQGDPGDRRRKRILVTDLGHRFMRDGEAVFNDLRREWADRVGQKDFARMEQLLADFVGDRGVRLEAPGRTE
ncbi:MAG: MarR family transcriptional regulator [Corynebacterium nuruki]|nr:MarR family transcriptional regulator [Corynebacterium nuruki]